MCSILLHYIGLNELNDKTAKEIQNVLDSMDTDQSGSINYTGIKAHL